MSLPIPQIRVEIFPQPGFADDNFAKGWVLGAGAFSSDGDIVTITSAADQVGYIEKALNDLDTDVHKKIQVRVPAGFTGTWAVFVRDKNLGNWIQIWGAQSGSGFFEASLPAGIILDRIMLECATVGVTYNAKFDYVFICKGAALVPSDSFDVIDDMTITLPLLENGVSGADLTFPNINGAYTGKISQFDRIIVYLWRKGDTMKKEFGGEVSDYGYNGSEKDNEYYIHLSCMDLGQQLQAPESLLQKSCSSVNGKTIILDAIALCPRLTDKFVDVDGDIASTHDMIYDDVLPYGVVTEICKKAETIGGVIGFDAYVDPAGNAHVFARNKYTSTVDLTGKILTYDHPFNAHSIKNKMTVFGALKKQLPLGGDEWTEPPSDPPPDWDNDGDAGTVISRSSESQAGNYSAKGAELESNDHRTWIHMRRKNIGVVPCDFPKKHYKKVWFKLKWKNSRGYQPWYGEVILRKNSTHYVSHQFSGAIVAKQDDWVVFEISVGRDETAEDYSKTWTKWGNWVDEDWAEITEAIFTLVWDPIPGGNGELFADGLHFKTYCNATVSDPVSIAKYGVRCAEPQSDDALQSDDECEKKAKSLIDFLKESIESLPLTIDGDNAFVPGYKQRIIISNDGLDVYFRILEITHHVRGVDWTTTLKHSNEPKMIDYIFASAGAPRAGGCTVVVPRDLSSLKEAVSAVVIA
jgi:hypothetical protein